MKEEIIWCQMTSKDAEELTSLLREREQNAKAGESCVVKEWNLSPDGLLRIKFVLDQHRAQKQGLIR